MTAGVLLACFVIGTVTAVVITLTGLFTTDPARREYAHTITVAVLKVIEAGVGSTAGPVP